MIDTNLRAVKRTPDGATILTKATANLRSLCQHCAIATRCKHRDRLDKVHQLAQLQAPVTCCAEYHYPIHFADTTGLDQPRFNTLRLGDAWQKRLRVGENVGLLDADRRLIQVRVVRHLEVVSKTIPGLLPYAHANHLLVAQQLSADEAAERMLKILRNNYGKLVFERQRVLTVIGF